MTESEYIKGRPCNCCGHAHTRINLGTLIQTCLECGEEERLDEFRRCPMSGCPGTMRVTETLRGASWKVQKRRCNCCAYRHVSTTTVTSRSTGKFAYGRGLEATARRIQDQIDRGEL